MLKAAIAKEILALKYSHTLCAIFLKLKILVIMEKTVSISILSFHFPLLHTFMFSGSFPSLE